MPILKTRSHRRKGCFKINIAIIDYGVGNLFSLKSSFNNVFNESGRNTRDMTVTVTGDPDVLTRADKLILPGVGAFEDAARKLRESGLDTIIKKEVASGKPLMGICLGMQMLFDRSMEYGVHDGLGLIKGTVEPIKNVIPSGLKIPHIGWNALKINGNKIFKYIKDGECVYFVHSFHAVTDEKYIIATTEYGADLTAAVADKNVFGCQFHPEKSGDTGLKILRAFCEL